MSPPKSPTTAWGLSRPSPVAKVELSSGWLTAMLSHWSGSARGRRREEASFSERPAPSQSQVLSQAVPARGTSSQVRVALWEELRWIKRRQRNERAQSMVQGRGGTFLGASGSQRNAAPLPCTTVGALSFHCLLSIHLSSSMASSLTHDG